jgi:hypothetical protein
MRCRPQIPWLSLFSKLDHQVKIRQPPQRIQVHTMEQQIANGAAHHGKNGALVRAAKGRQQTWGQGQVVGLYREIHDQRGESM